MQFLARRLEAFNRDELPDWRRSPTVLGRALRLVPSLLEFFLFYVLAFAILAGVVALMALAWIFRVDRKSS
ncbi:MULTISPECIES: hypothetical protein [unclassified Sinorhizobium]|uniref:hypothetical protein n=1 Tax=unclassified Sinorhizobium TaxID=2613772 RepID=UPI0024C304BF|nr:MULTISPECIES: hypothetical protein [unclassified Sinorhizobium]MDK1374646.1 hypothetical protein [Sinorhizobium sp. 6-70]MDK1480720.1 hypothetical protein [Sinorhizobium sp. 6-117]